MSPSRRGRWTAAAGLAAGVLYVAATAAGSWLDPQYSQLRQPVSDLTATGASTRAVLVAPYLVYNLLCAGFAIGLYRGSTRSRLFKVGLGLLLLDVLAGIMMVTWCAEDLGGVVSSAAGAGHLVFAGLASLAIVAGCFVFGVAFRHAPGWRGLSGFSLAVGSAFVVLGPLAALATARHSPLAGLAERATIGLFVVWLLVVSGHAAGVARTRAA